LPKELNYPIEIFAYSDSPTAPTGFGTVSRELYVRFFNSGKYNVRIAGVNYHGNKQHGFPFMIHPLANATDPYGIKQFRELLTGGKKPDIIFLFQDLFVIGGYVANGQNLIDVCRSVYKDVPIVIYFPIDGGPICRMYYDQTVKRADVAITLSQYGMDMVKRIDPTSNVQHIYHGVDTSTFKPLPEQTMSMLKEKNGMGNRFVVTNVNRFQPRKNIPATLRAVALIRHGYKVCKRCGHYYSASLDDCDLNRCGGEYVKITKPNEDIALYLQMETEHPIMGKLPADTLHNLLINSGFLPNDRTIFMPHPSMLLGNITSVQVNEIYNFSDLYVSTTLGEGFGLCALEAAAAGTRVIIPDNTTAREVAPFAHLCKNAEYVTMAGDSGHIRPVVDVRSVVRAIEEEYVKWVKNGRKKVLNKAGIEHAKKFNWDDIADQFMAVFENAITNFERKKFIKIFTL